MSKPNSASRPPPPARRLVVGVTGASGAAYAVRFVELAVRAGREVALVVTRPGRLVLADEADLAGTADAPDFAPLWPKSILAHISYTPAERLDAPPASGSFDAEAVVIIPCTMNTAAAIAHGLASNLVQRAARVALKEGRPLVLVPRETPMTAVDLENLAHLASAGAAVIPAMPAFYHRPRSVGDLVDFVVAKVLARIGIEHDLNVRWPGCLER
ncbi:MAG TPA: UbiX family flavin prenyltransferase [Phycisphaerae bacterium]|nr:UbiX family flavin prenyltransferase [Phycisphaerae bacterium]